MLNSHLSIFFNCYCLYFWCHSQESIVKSNVMKLSPPLCFLLGVYNFSSYIFRSSVNLCIWYKVKVQLHSFPCVCIVLSTPFDEVTVLYPLHDHGTLVEDHSTIYTRVYLWALYSVSSVYIICLYVSTMGFIYNKTVTKRNMHLKLYFNVLFH